jgi:transcriptional regulator with XRE-family HTH domain
MGGMTLAEYLKSSRGNAIDLSRALGVSHTTVARWASGTMEPSLVTCARIEKITRRKVTIREMVATAQEAAARRQAERAA